MCAVFDPCFCGLSVLDLHDGKLCPGANALSLDGLLGGIEDNEFAWKSGLSLAVLFLASILTLSVGNVFSGRAKRGGDE